MFIFISILALNFIIFIHELGHFLFARLFKVKVEVFSIGIGPSLFKIKIKDTEYRISPIFLGGYCKLKGAEHLENELKLNRQLEADEDSIFGISHFKKILIYFAGPLFNLILALIIFIAIEIIGVVYLDYSGKISVKNTFLSKFKDGDIILKVNNNNIQYFSDLSKFVALKDSKITFTVLRDNNNVIFEEYTSLDKLLKEIVPWEDLTINKVEANSPAGVAGLRPNDKIISINNVVLSNHNDLKNLISNLDVNVVDIQYDRSGEIITSKLVFQDTNRILGISIFPSIERVIKTDNLIIAFQNSLSKILNILGHMFYSIIELFTNFKNNSRNIVGPVGMMNILVNSSSVGFLHWFNAIAVLNLIIAGMNLFFFVIPMLDGGQIFISLIELLRGKRFSAKFIYYFYFIGFIFILSLLTLGFLNDLSVILGLFYK